MGFWDFGNSFGWSKKQSEKKRREKEEREKPQVGGLAGAYQFDTEPVEDTSKWDFLD
jgi:hypothetical protein